MRLVGERDPGRRGERNWERSTGGFMDGDLEVMSLDRGMENCCTLVCFTVGIGRTVFPRRRISRLSYV